MLKLTSAEFDDMVGECNDDFIAVSHDVITNKTDREVGHRRVFKHLPTGRYLLAHWSYCLDGEPRLWSAHEVVEKTVKKTIYKKKPDGVFLTGTAAI